jgi:hypothetical protein
MADMIDAIADKLLEDHMTLMAENKLLREQRDYLLNALNDAAKDLIEVVRMPNIEYVAEAHNIAVRKIKNLNLVLKGESNGN